MTERGWEAAGCPSASLRYRESTSRAMVGWRGKEVQLRLYYPSRRKCSTGAASTSQSFPTVRLNTTSIRTEFQPEATSESDRGYAGYQLHDHRQPPFFSTPRPAM